MFNQIGIRRNNTLVLSWVDKLFCTLYQCPTSMIKDNVNSINASIKWFQLSLIKTWNDSQKLSGISRFPF